MKYRSLENNEQQIKIYGALKKSIEVLFSKMKEIKPLFADDSVFSSDHLSHGLQIDFDFSSLHYVNRKSPLLLKKVDDSENELTKHWGKKPFKKDINSVEQYDRVFTQKNASFNKEPLNNLGELYFSKSYNIKYTEFDFYRSFCWSNVIDKSSVFIEKCRDYANQKIERIKRQLVYLDKLNKVLFFLDKRNYFRQIIKFLFKNLDDSHSSVNNFIALKLENYLLNENLNEKRIYRQAY